MDIVYTVVLPLASVVIFAVLGMLRGARREAYVSGAIALAALLVLEWGVRWGDDLTAIISGLGSGDAVFYVSLAILVLTVLVLGYGLGSSVVRGAPDGTSRALGFLLGAVNGAAFAGYLLRIAFIYLDNSSGSSAVYTNPVSYWLVFWAGWYPVALAAIGAVVALVRAFAGDEDLKVSSATTATATATTPSLSAPPAPPASYAGQGATPPSGPSAPTTANVPPPPSPASGTQGSATGYSYTPPAEGGYMYAPPDEQWRTTAPDLAANKAISSMSTSDFAANLTETKLPADSGPPTPMTTLPIGDEKYYTPPFGTSVVEVKSDSEALDASKEKGTEASSAETRAIPVVSAAAANSAEKVNGLTCRVCGSSLSPGQLYCTECGTKVEG
jgi:uncharacterized membrane protein required for colicin V production